MINKQTRYHTMQYLSMAQNQTLHYTKVISTLQYSAPNMPLGSKFFYHLSIIPLTTLMWFKNFVLNPFLFVVSRGKNRSQVFPYNYLCLYSLGEENEKDTNERREFLKKKGKKKGEKKINFLKL